MTTSESSTKSSEIKDDTGGAPMSLWEHLGELRTRLIRCAFAVMSLFFVGMAGSDYVLAFLKKPLVAVLPDRKDALIFTAPFDIFVVNVKVAFVVAVVGSSPVWIYQFWKFIEPALYPSERKRVVPFAAASITLFLIGVFFCYFLILPLSLEFLIKMGGTTAIPMITITDYVSTVGVLLLGFGVVFETPLILILLSLVGLYDAKDLSGKRNYVIIACVVVGAVLTPPDPISQLAMAIPLYLMYEVSIVILRIMEKARGKEVEKARGDAVVKS